MIIIIKSIYFIVNIFIHKDGFILDIYHLKTKGSGNKQIFTIGLLDNQRYNY